MFQTESHGFSTSSVYPHKIPMKSQFSHQSPGYQFHPRGFSSCPTFAASFAFAFAMGTRPNGTPLRCRSARPRRSSVTWAALLAKEQQVVPSQVELLASRPKSNKVRILLQVSYWVRESFEVDVYFDVTPLKKIGCEFRLVYDDVR